MCPESSTQDETSQATLTADDYRAAFVGLASRQRYPYESVAKLFEAAASALEARDERIAELEEEAEALEERIGQVEHDASQAIAQVRHQGYLAHREAQERADQERMDHENTQRRLRETERRR